MDPNPSFPTATTHSAPDASFDPPLCLSPCSGGCERLREAGRRGEQPGRDPRGGPEDANGGPPRRTSQHGRRPICQAARSLIVIVIVIQRQTVPLPHLLGSSRVLPRAPRQDRSCAQLASRNFPVQEAVQLYHSYIYTEVWFLGKAGNFCSAERNFSLGFRPKTTALFFFLVSRSIAFGI